MKKQNFLIAASLLVSMAIYLFYRTDKTVINGLVIRIISIGHYYSIRQSVHHFLPLNKFIIYSLPEGLWTFCITLTSKPFIIQQKERRIDCTVVPLIFCIGLEIAQLFHLTNGRFDPMDILVTLLFWAIAVLGFQDFREKQSLFTPINGRRIGCFVSYGIVYLAHVLN